jgi:ribosomal protein L11 methyltransferase
MTTGHHIQLRVRADALSAFEDALEGLGGALVTGGREGDGCVPVDVYLATAPDPDELAHVLAHAAERAGVEVPAVTSAALPDVDWVQRAYEGLPPIHAGRFFIYGEHNAAAPRPAGAIAFRIEANMAFGTGRHETTLGCLLELERLAKAGTPVRRALDMGAGSGLLAFAVARLWRAPVLAVDNDATSVRLCRENAHINGVTRWVDCLQSPGYARAEVARRGAYDLICANILAEPLVAMAGDLRAHLAPGGLAILSGMLNHQARRVLLRHRAQGLVLVRRRVIGEWTTLVLRRPARRRISGQTGST